MLFRSESNQWSADPQSLDSSLFRSSKHSYHMSATDEYSPDCSLVLNRNGLRSGSVVECVLWMRSDESVDGVKLVCSVDKAGKSFFWNGSDASDYQISKKNWFCMTAVWQLPEGIPEAAEMKIYVWNEGRRSFNIDDFKIMLYRSRPNTFIPPM